MRGTIIAIVLLVFLLLAFGYSWIVAHSYM
jgi:hypothetical protein